MRIGILRYDIEAIRHGLDERQSRGSSMRYICSPTWDVLLSSKRRYQELNQRKLARNAMKRTSSWYKMHMRAVLRCDRHKSHPMLCENPSPTGTIKGGYKKRNLGATCDLFAPYLRRTTPACPVPPRTSKTPSQHHLHLH